MRVYPDRRVDSMFDICSVHVSLQMYVPHLLGGKSAEKIKSSIFLAMGAIFCFGLYWINIGDISALSG